jgi:hypothetical protein
MPAAIISKLPHTEAGKEQEPEESAVDQPASTSEALRRALDLMGSQLEDAALEEDLQHRIKWGAIKGGGAILSAGYLAWLLRAGPMLASAMSAIPMWAKFDPLPVLLAGKRRKKEEDERRKKEGGDEATVARILDAVRSVSSVRKRGQ